jgi:hypothetical protein
MKISTRPIFSRIARLPLYLLLILLGSTAALAYQVVQLEDAHELRLSDITLPTRGSGSITFKACATCTATSMRLNATARYRFNGNEVTLQDFLATVVRIRESSNAGEDSSITVFFNIQTQQLTRIELFDF